MRPASDHGEGLQVQVQAVGFVRFGARQGHAQRCEPGQVQHDFKIAGKKTILLNPGKSSKLTVTLKKGKYHYLCTVAGHAKLGMQGTFTVK